MRTYRPRPARVLAVALVAALGLVAGACSSGSTSGAGSTSGTIGDEGTPVDGGAVAWGVSSEPDGWNPHDARWAQPSALMGSAVLEPLATTDNSAQAQPWLATSWTPSAAYDSWTLTLREGVTFQDGEAFDASSVKLNIEDATTAPLSSVAVKSLIKGATVLDPLTVRVDLFQPWAAFPSSFLAGQSALQMAPAMLRSPDRGADQPIGTGPYAFESWQPSSSFKTKKNPGYWQQGLPHLDSLEFKVITDPATRAAALQSGDIDLMLTTNVNDANNLASTHTVIKNWDTEPGMAMTNTLPEVDGKPNPLNDVHARRALAYATDRKAIAAGIGEGVVSVNSPFSPSSYWGLPEDQNGYVDFDVEKAKQEVARYEADTGASSLSITLSGSPDNDSVRLMQLLQSQWSDAGIDTTLETKDASSLITDVVGGKYQVVLFSIYSSPDPDQDHYFWSADTAQGPGKVSINFTQYTTPEMEAALKIGRENPDPAARKAAYDDLVHQINAAAVNIWTFSTPYSIVADTSVKGLRAATLAPFGNFQPKTWLGELWLGR